MMTLTRSRIVFGLVLGALLLPWLWQMAQMPANLDMLWLCEGLKRIFAGGTMSEVAYDPNPPLSFLIYTLPVLLDNLADVPLHWSSIGQAFALLGISALVLWQVSKDLPSLSEAHRLVLLGAYLIANIGFPGYFFGERDHLIGIVLLPLLLVQTSLTNASHQMTSGRWLFLFLATGVLLLKPHFIIGPLCLLAHRLIRRGFSSVLRSPDFIAFCVMGISYVLILFFFFSDYVQIILPDALRFYGATGMRFLLLKQMIPELAATAVLTGVTFLMKTSTTRSVTRILLGGAWLSLMVVFLQGMGFFYHFIPALGCLLTASGLILYEVLPGRIKAVPVSLIACAAAIYAYSLLGNPVQKPQAYNDQSPVVQEILKGTAGANKSFFLYGEGMLQIHETAYYHHLTHASRFAALWFMQGLRGAENSEVAQADIQKYGTMVAEDLQRYKPAVMILLVPPEFDKQSALPEMFAGQEAFQQQWSQYYLDHQINDPVSMPELNLQYDRLFDVYYRRDSKPAP